MTNRVCGNPTCNCFSPKFVLHCHFSTTQRKRAPEASFFFGWWIKSGANRAANMCLYQGYLATLPNRLLSPNAARFGGLRSKTLSPFTYARNATTYSPKRPPPTKEALMANIPVPFLYGIYPKSARTLYGVFGASPHCVCLVSEIGFFAVLRNYRVALRCLLRGIGGSRRPIFRKAS